MAVSVSWFNHSSESLFSPPFRSLRILCLDLCRVFRLSHYQVLLEIVFSSIIGYGVSCQFPSGHNDFHPCLYFPVPFPKGAHWVFDSIVASDWPWLWGLSLKWVVPNICGMFDGLVMLASGGLHSHHGCPSCFQSVGSVFPFTAMLIWNLYFYWLGHYFDGFMPRSYHSTPRSMATRAHHLQNLKSKERWPMKSGPSCGS